MSAPTARSALVEPPFVLDASALVEVLAATNPNAALFRRVLTGTAFAPEIIDLETLNSVRKYLFRGAIAEQTAAGVAQNLQEIPIARSPHRSLLPRVWELRHSITPYDAAYIALAEKLKIPLVTCDAKLGGSNGHHAEIEVYPAS
ncbi:type II toxin-antitoxin system VapC family toxin [Actinokineospora sp.]|uniref:type II toxin-antitoxin system VapC family toxin n=1 Tax=Actinokineospora sp. TaxID=1872133 RepID=UPI0040375FFE